MRERDEHPAGQEASLPGNPDLVNDVRRMIEDARSAVAVAVNVGLTMLYWRIGRRIGQEVLKGERAEYGKEILATLSQELEADYERGWGEKHLGHCLRFAESSPEEQIVSALRRHFRLVVRFLHCESLCPKGAMSSSPGLRRRRRGYPGISVPCGTNPIGIAADRDTQHAERDTTPVGLNAATWHDTRGSGATAATPGYGTESRWDSEEEE